MGDIADLQAAVAAWHTRQFPNGTLSIQGHVLAEECGEVARCLAKGAEDIRGGSTHWSKELRKETGDVLIALLTVCHYGGFSLEDAILAGWENIRHREIGNTPKLPTDTCECGMVRAQHEVLHPAADASCGNFRLYDRHTEWEPRED